MRAAQVLIPLLLSGCAAMIENQTGPPVQQDLIPVCIKRMARMTYCERIEWIPRERVQAPPKAPAPGEVR